MTDVNDSYDVDGAATQWASGVESQKQLILNEIASNGGTSIFPALFDLEGNLVPAKLIETRFGPAWGVFDKDASQASGHTNSFVSFFSASKAKSEVRRFLSDERKGYYVGTVKALAGVALQSNGGFGYSGASTVHPVVYRKDGGFSLDAEIVDNGK
jgi:hypothetical protein